MHLRQGGGVGVIQTARMPKAALAVAGAAVGVWDDVKNNVVGPFRITGNSADRIQQIEPQNGANAPGDHVIGAGGIAAHSHTADLHTAGLIETEPAAEDVHPADTKADHRVVRCAELV